MMKVGRACPASSGSSSLVRTVWILVAAFMMVHELSSNTAAEAAAKRRRGFIWHSMLLVDGNRNRFFPARAER